MSEKRCTLAELGAVKERARAARKKKVDPKVTELYLKRLQEQKYGCDHGIYSIREAPPKYQIWGRRPRDIVYEVKKFVNWTGAEEVVEYKTVHDMCFCGSGYAIDLFLAERNLERAKESLKKAREAAAEGCKDDVYTRECVRLKKDGPLPEIVEDGYKNTFFRKIPK